MSRFQPRVVLLHLNNEGVRSLRAGNWTYAAQLFTRGIYLVKSELVKASNSMSSSTTTTTPHVSGGLAKQHVTTATSTISQLLQHQGRIYTTEIPFPLVSPPSDGEYVFNRAIIIDLPVDADADHVDFSNPTISTTTPTVVQTPLEQQELEDHQDCIHFFSTVLTYNLALVHHAMATTTTSSSSAAFTSSSPTSASIAFDDEKKIVQEQILQRAERFYQLALKLINGNSRTLNKLNISLLLKLACLNNLSQVRFSRGEYSSSEYLLSHISSIFAAGVGSSRRQQSSFSSNEEEIVTRRREEEASTTRLEQYESDPVLNGLLINVLFLLHAGGARSPPQVAAAA